MRYKEYKKVDIPWLDEVPSHWEIVRNKNLFKHKKNIIGNESESAQLLSLTTKGIKKINIEDSKGKTPMSYDTYQKVCKDDLVLCLFDLDVSAVFSDVSKYYGMISPAYQVFESDIVNMNYYKYIFDKIFQDRSYKLHSKSLRYTITPNNFLMLDMIVPPKDEQEQIARFLDWKINYIDRLIENENKKIKIIKKSIKSAHKDLILGKLKNKSMNFTDKKFVDGIPSNWKVVKLKKVLNKIEIDANKDDEIVICSNHGYSFYRGEKKIGLSSEDNRYYQKVEKDQIMIHGMDTWHGAICISNHNGKCTRVVHVCESKQNNEYIVYYLRLLAFMGMYKPYSNGVRQNTSDFRSWNVLGNIDILLPPKTEQDSIVKKLSKYIRINKQTIKISEERLKLLELVKKSIISDVVTGKIDVRNIETPKCKTDENIDINYDKEEIEEGV